MRYTDTLQTMENHVEKNMESEMETGIIQGLIRVWVHLFMENKPLP